MIISTKQNVGKTVQEPQKHDNVIIDNNVLHIYVY